MLKQILGCGAKWTSYGFLLAGCCLCFVAGCRSPRRGEPTAGPVVPSDPRVRAGQLVFFQHCHPCHPGGEGGLGPALNDKPLPAFAIRTQVRKGLGVMPAFTTNQISDEQLDSLVAYMKFLRKGK